jgi:hypothetical protein
MRRVQIDEKLPIILQSALQELEIVDAKGSVVGHFKPKYDIEFLKAEGVWPTDEEVEEAVNFTGPTHTTEQVIARLRAIA